VVKWSTKTGAGDPEIFTERIPFVETRDYVRTILRTWQSCGAGPVHYFVTFPPREKDRITVKLANRLTTPFREKHPGVTFSVLSRTSTHAVLPP